MSLTNICQAQPILEWLKRYPDTNLYQAGSYALAIDDSENIYITGYENHGNNPPYLGYCTIKYNANGTQQWVSNYFSNNSGGRYAYAIALDKSYNVYVTGYSFETGRYFDYCTIKYNSNGLQQWVQYYDDSAHGQDQAQKIAVDRSGNIYVTGFSSISGYSFQIATIKYSTDGRQLWVQRYGTPYGDTHANGIVIDSNCNIYITGANNKTSVTLKYDSSGVQQWVRTYNGNVDGAAANSIALDKYSNIYITGRCRNIGTTVHFDFFTIKYSSSGDQQWVSTYNTDSTIYDSDYGAQNIVVDDLLNIYVNGYFQSNQSAPVKLCTIKYTNSGELIWVQRDTVNLIDYNYMNLDHDNNNIYISCAYNDLTFVTLKYDSSGLLKWKQIDSVLGNPFGLKIDRNYNIYITGGTGQMITLKYSQLTGVKKIVNESPVDFKLFQNYPNPFNPKTKIKFEIRPPSTPLLNKEGTQEVVLKIYDILGREAATLINEKFRPGTYEATWDASNYSSGIYFYRIIAGNFSQTKKMLLIK